MKSIRALRRSHRATRFLSGFINASTPIQDTSATTSRALNPMHAQASAFSGSAAPCTRTLSQLGCSTSNRCTPSTLPLCRPFRRLGSMAPQTLPNSQSPLVCTCSSSSSSTSRTSSTAPSTPSVRELQALRGVGPVNASLLMAKQITSVHDLQEIFHHTCRKDKEELTRYLVHEVGFRNTAHCRSVADHLEDLPWAPPTVRAKLAVEGNIGAGKSTFLSCLAGEQGTLELQDIVEIVPEPVDQWRSVDGVSGREPINLLDRFYKDPAKYAYTFQHYVLLTRMQKDRIARTSSKPLRVLERSIFSDRMVFVRAMHEAGYLGDLELSVYDSWFSMEIAQDRGLMPDGFIYLKAKPDTCMQRLKLRNRSEEAGVDPGYLQLLHDKHESWLHDDAQSLQAYLKHVRSASFANSAAGGGGGGSIGAGTHSDLVRTTSRLQYAAEKGLQVSPELAQLAGPDGRRLILGDPEMKLLSDAPASIKDSIMFLRGPQFANAGNQGSTVEEGRILAALSGVPALILDHDQNDIIRDADARQDYADKVKAFSQYVHSIRSIRAFSSVVEGAPNALMTSGSNNGGSGGGSAQSSLSWDEVDSLKRILGEYRRFVEVQKRQSAQWDGNLRGLEGMMARLLAVEERDEGVMKV